MKNTPFDIFKNQVRTGAEEYRVRLFDSQPDSEVNQVARYTILEGGHRWRAMVAIASGLIFGPQAYEKVLPCACGVELAHGASLILDDLPSMDNAGIRRGKPCPLLVFSP
jgi:geranylgeranyl pyrophosphate synthase